jgi:ABC-type amino acid transport substrate-binding protein
LSVYFVAFFLAALLLGGVLLPGAVALLTPFGYRETVSACRDAMITAFVTSNVFIVLPMLSEQCARLAAARGLDTHGARTAPAVLVPIAFNFPTAGKLLTLLFVPFGAWMHGQPLAVGEYPGLLVNGLFSYFAKAQVALPFLLDRFELPGDLFNLYIPSTLVNGKLDSAVGAMSLFALTLLTTAALAGQQRLRLPGLVRGAVLVALLLALLLPGTRALLAVFAADAGQRKAQALQSMHLARADMSQVSVLAEAGPRSPTPEAGTPGIQRIRARGVIRVAYQPERLPFSFRNSEGQLVGYDVELAAQLARDLGVRLELVPTSPDRIEADLAAGVVDLVPGVRYTHHWIGRLRLSAPYMEATLGMLVRDRDREQYLDLAGLRASARRLRVAVPGQSDLYEDHVREFLAGVDYELVELESWAAIASATERFDMLVGLAEVGMAWSLLHPEYTVVVPRDHVVRRPLAFALDPRDESLARVVDEWVVLQRARGNLDSAYDYWVLGKGADQRRPRWSIVRDVLGWMD